MTPPEPTRLGEIVWLDPFPDALLDPQARYEQTETISLAFVTALQMLPPRQIAVLILRDVLGFPALEVAVMWDTTVESVTSALKRARAGVQRGRRRAALGPTAEATVVVKFVTAYESANIDALVALLTDDVFISMPPMPLEYEGLHVVTRFCADVLFRPSRGATWSLRGPTDSPPSAPLSERPPGLGTASACSCSPSTGTGSVP